MTFSRPLAFKRSFNRHSIPTCMLVECKGEESLQNLDALQRHGTEKFRIKTVVSLD